MKLLRRKKFVLPAIAGIAALVGAGVAYGYFTSSGSGTGSAQVGSATNLVITQTNGAAMYDSLIDPSSYQWSMQYPSGGEFGNDIQLANGGGLLSSVVVELANFLAGTTATGPITLNIYTPPATGGSVTAADLIATDTQSFNVPGTSTGYAPTPSNANLGIDNDPVTFNQFTYGNLAPKGMAVPLPSTVVFGISFSSSAPSGVNVDMSSGSSPDQITVGSDPHTGWLFYSQPSGTTNGEITCSNVSPVFTEYNTTVQEPANCGMDNYSNQQLWSIPAVEFNTSATMSGLVPNSVPQPVDFTVTNPGTSTEALNGVTISVAYDPSNNEVESTPGDTSTDVSGCYYYWFDTSGETWSGGSIAPGSPVSGAGSIWMATDTTDNQNACEGASIGLIFGAS